MGFRLAVVNARTGSDQQAITREYVAAAAAQDCQLVCFPEGFLSLMQMGHPVFCTLDSPMVGNMVDAAQRHGIHILSGLWERGSPHCYLSALYITPEGQARVIHRKLVPAKRERLKGVTPGKSLRVCETALCTIGASLCLENWLPEIPRALALAGAEFIYAPSYLGLAVRGRFDYYEIWKQMLRIRAVENVCYVAACTNTIAQRPLALVVDPDGRVIAERELPGMVTAMVHPEHVRERRAGRGWHGVAPPLQVRRLYADLVRAGYPFANS